ncbi:hypothetical protein H0A36_28915 [Endozoicomonas sp. SM1973]|uniref:Uncharacterized protein n=1 Tax=Spartinivicinus marinus TaxID=2994442 RepID=A0A853I812_9GAMM|nr:hypothetical protein [Spartinivicinus marinus]MCX4030268.1 hypothetical protein [Spartinivicinus marinus]NYZ70040.1 hypothetical protein [Spartinivicinus marinus]
MEKAVSLLNTLDGQMHTLLCVERNDNWQLQIGGGPDSFVVTAIDPTEKNLTLLNFDGDDDEFVELCTGGQYAEFTTSIVVDKNTAILAIEKYYNGDEENLDWEYE